MEIFIAVLPLFSFFFVIADFTAMLLALRQPKWVPLFHLVMLEVLWICQMFTEPLSAHSFQLLFVGSIEVAFVVVLYIRQLRKEIQASIALEAGNPIGPAAAPPPAAEEELAEPDAEVLLGPDERSVRIQIIITKD